MQTTHQALVANQRPALHFTPRAGWINDPNGLIYVDGEYHLFYQHNPAAPVWGPMHWGHAVSRDLLTWQELPIALAPDDIGAIFSGSAVLDRDNTAGFGAGAMVAIFTQDTPNPQQRQVQSLAYSLDHGRSWTKYAGNPVLPPPIGQVDFRDPKVFWYDDGQRSHWVMALAVDTEIRFYQSANLKDWVESSRFGAERGSHGGVWECPDLLQLNIEGSAEKRWVLVVSVQKGAPAGGSGVQYFVGQFDGATFVSQDAPDRVRWADYGADFYAVQAWNDAPNARRLWLAWMSNWDYGPKTPASAWRGSMTLPRQVSLRPDGDNVVLVQQPLPELTHVRQPALAWAIRHIDRESVALAAAANEAHELHVVFRLAQPVANDATVGIRIGASNASAEIGYEPAQQRLFIRRGPIADAPGFGATHSAPLSPRNGKIDLRVFIDTTSIEVFADEGRLVMTEQIFPETGNNALSCFATNAAVDVDRLALYTLVTE